MANYCVVTRVIVPVYVGVVTSGPYCYYDPDYVIVPVYVGVVTN